MTENEALEMPLAIKEIQVDRLEIEEKITDEKDQKLKNAIIFRRTPPIKMR